MQGSATSPAGMALFHNLLSYYNRIAPFLQGFFKTFCKREAGAFGKAAMPRAPETVSAKKNKYRGGKPRRNGYLGKTPYKRADMRCRKAATTALRRTRYAPASSHKQKWLPPGGGLLPPVVKMKFQTAGAYGMPPTVLVFRRAHGASCACGVVRQPPTGFVPSSCVGEAVVALRQLISSRPDIKLLFPFCHQIPQFFFFF